MVLPQLIEHSSRQLMMNTLQQCHTTRVNMYYYIFNAAVFIGFVLIVGITLYYCNKDKLSEEEKQQKMLKDQQYIMSKIRFFQEESKINNESRYSSITNLPFIQA